VFKYVLTSATIVFVTNRFFESAKEIITLSTPGSDAEKVHLIRVERNAEAAAKGAANGTTSVVGKPNTDGWFTFLTKKNEVNSSFLKYFHWK
jgi:hypothetical protein